jgi:starvation-inducible DNA-binding protein
MPVADIRDEPDGPGGGIILLWRRMKAANAATREEHMSTTQEARREIDGGVGAALERFLADTYVLYLRTQNYHWNVTGRRFAELHAFFDRQYKALAEAVDAAAERLRALGYRAPGSLPELARLTSLTEDDGGWPPADEMVRTLLRDHEAVIGSAKSLLREAEAAQDVVTSDLLTGRLAFHEKEVWMLRSLLG